MTVAFFGLIWVKGKIDRYLTSISELYSDIQNLRKKIFSLKSSLVKRFFIVSGSPNQS